MKNIYFSLDSKLVFYLLMFFAMKNFWLLTTLWLVTLALAGCNSNCNCENAQDEDAVLNQRIEYCNEHWWTHSLIHSPTAVYGECAFPSGVTCEDTILWTDECNFEPDISEIDTAEERQTWCENNVDWWMQDMMEWATYYGIEWDGDEEEIEEDWKLVMITRNFYAKYDKDWKHWKLPWRCEANFVDWSNWTTYGQEFIDE